MIDGSLTTLIVNILWDYILESQVNPSRKPVWNNRENIHHRTIHHVHNNAPFTDTYCQITQ